MLDKLAERLEIVKGLDAKWSFVQNRKKFQIATFQKREAKERFDWVDEDNIGYMVKLLGVCYDIHKNKQYVEEVRYNTTLKRLRIIKKLDIAEKQRGILARTWAIPAFAWAATHIEQNTKHEREIAKTYEEVATRGARTNAKLWRLRDLEGNDLSTMLDVRVMVSPQKSMSRSDEDHEDEAEQHGLIDHMNMEKAVKLFPRLDAVQKRGWTFSEDGELHHYDTNTVASIARSSRASLERAFLRVGMCQAVDGSEIVRRRRRYDQELVDSYGLQIASGLDLPRPEIDWKELDVATQAHDEALGTHDPIMRWIGRGDLGSSKVWVADASVKNGFAAAAICGPETQVVIRFTAFITPSEAELLAVYIIAKYLAEGELTWICSDALWVVDRMGSANWAYRWLHELRHRVRYGWVPREGRSPKDRRPAWEEEGALEKKILRGIQVKADKLAKEEREKMVEEACELVRQRREAENRDEMAVNRAVQNARIYEEREIAADAHWVRAEAGVRPQLLAALGQM